MASRAERLDWRTRADGAAAAKVQAERERMKLAPDAEPTKAQQERLDAIRDKAYEDMSRA